MASVNLQFLSVYSGGVSAFGDLADPMSFPRETDSGTGTKNKIVTNQKPSVMRIQINKNPSIDSMTPPQKYVRLQNLSIRTIQSCLTVLLHKKASFPFIWRLLYY